MKGKLRCLHSIFLILLSCRDTIGPLCSDADETSDDKTDQTEENNLYFILLSRVQFVLLQLVKTYSALQKRLVYLLKEGTVLFNDALNTFLFTVIWRQTILIVTWATLSD